MIPEVKIYVYGSCLFSGETQGGIKISSGGYGCVIVSDGHVITELSGGFSNTTNARMDIRGITVALKKITSTSNIVVYLNNGYVIDTLTKGWLEKWKKKGYVKKKNADLWKELDRVVQSQQYNITFKHGHDVHLLPYFKKAEHLAKVVSSKNDLPVDILSTISSGGFFDFINEITPTLKTTQAKTLEIAVGQPIKDSFCVDAACSGRTGVMEYRGVEVNTGKEIFKMKYEEATNNIGEFLAIVYALAFYKKQNKPLPILYSDSYIAISWVKQKKCKTRLVRNFKNGIVFQHIERAEQWLYNNKYETKIMKWHTKVWGEIPADYGRK